MFKHHIAQLRRPRPVVFCNLVAFCTAALLGACGGKGSTTLLERRERDPELSACGRIPLPTQCALFVCDASTGEVSESDSPAGTPCNDGSRFTYGDQCNGVGGCIGTPVTCPPSTQCTQYSANGTAICTRTDMPATQSCDDGQACTYSDHCDGAGTCKGTTVKSVNMVGQMVDGCVSDTCGTRSCNGGPSCTETLALADTACNDGNLCTYGETCTGIGTCVGQPITCTNSACATSTCNGTAVCTVTPKPPTTLCQAAGNGYNATFCDGANASCPIIAASCQAGFKVCGSTCIATAACCSNWDCTVKNASGTVIGYNSCGANGVCSGSPVCASGYQLCGTTCIPDSGCCSASDCTAPAHGQVACTNSACVVTGCDATFTQCGSACIAQAACCG